MKNVLYDHGYGKEWTDICVEKRERYKTSVTDFHEHDFYEINLILSGDVKAFAANQVVEGTSNKIVLAKPDTSHFVSCNPGTLYSSLYLAFSDEFIKTYDIECTNVMSVFGDRGNIFTLSSQQSEKCREIINSIDEENNLFRKRILVYYLLSYISDISESTSAEAKIIPDIICEALDYINEFYMEKIVAKDIADKIHIGRTTLMTQFKKYTGKTLNEYVINRRLRNAIKLLAEGKTAYEAAVNSGFSDSSAFIQCFKRVFKMTPKQYIADLYK